MKRLLLVGAAALIGGLGACNQKPPEAPTAKSFLFPALGASPYAADYAMGGEATPSMHIKRAGANQRMERAMGKAGRTGVMLVEGATGKMYSFQVGEGAPQAAMLIEPGKLGAMKDALDIETAAKTSKPTHMGSDTVAGVGCEVWEMTPPAPTAPAAAGAEAAAAVAEASEVRQVCVTNDGIMLRVQRVGAAAPDIVATKVERGPQDPALFALPAGYQVVDMSECMNAGAAMMAAVKAGKKPDMALMQKCQGMSKLMSGH